MADTQSSLARLLNARGLAAVVPRLQPEALHRVIQHYGLEDCAELVALATPAQLTKILDTDIWRVQSAGEAESFDVDRFGLWMEVLAQAGASVAADKLRGLDIELSIAGFSGLLTVFDIGAVVEFVTSDGDLRSYRRPDREWERCQIGGYEIEQRRTCPWDALVEVLAFLEAEHPTFFHQLMRGCVSLSNGEREPDGFHNLLEDREQDLFDLASDRAGRREQQGYVAPAEARAFLRGAREIRLDGPQPPANPIAQAHFRALDLDALTSTDVNASGVALLAAAPADAVDMMDAETIASVTEILRDAGAMPSAPRALLPAGPDDAPRLPHVHAHLESQPEEAQALAFLTNAVVAGCTVQDRPLTPAEAADAALATCNLGFERWPTHWPGRSLIAAFEAGCAVLHREACLHAAAELLRTIRALRCSDRDIQMQLKSLARELTRHLRDGTPWHARAALEVIVMLDGPSWLALRALIDEFPVLHAAAGAGPRRRLSVQSSDFTFISDGAGLAVVHEFLRALPAALLP